MNHISDMRLFVLVAQLGSLANAARELGITPSAVTKRLLSLERRLGVRLLNRTTRSISLTSEGEIYFENGKRILADIDSVESLITEGKNSPQGLLRINAPLGFGRSYIAPLVSEFVKMYPDVNVQLVLSDRPIRLPDEAVDISIRFGDIPDSRLIARKISSNRRLICASPNYLKKHGTPLLPHDLSQHQCITLRQNDTFSGMWQLTKGEERENVRVGGNLSTNDGEVALKWAIDGHGILMRAEWDIARYLRDKRLELVLEDYSTPAADIYAVYLEKQHLSAKVSYFLDYLKQAFSIEADTNSPTNPIW